MQVTANSIIMLYHNPLEHLSKTYIVQQDSVQAIHINQHENKNVHLQHIKITHQKQLANCFSPSIKH